MNKAQKIAVIVVLTIILLGFLTSCTKNEEICECTKTTKIEDRFRKGSSPVIKILKVETFYECLEEVERKDVDTDLFRNTFYTIKCKQ